MLLSAWYYAWHTFRRHLVEDFYCLHVVLLLSLPLMSAFHHKVKHYHPLIYLRDKQGLSFLKSRRSSCYLSSVQTFLTFTILYLNTFLLPLSAHTLPCGSEEGFCSAKGRPMVLCLKMLSCSQRKDLGPRVSEHCLSLQAAAVSKTLCISSEALGQSMLFIWLWLQSV